MMWGSRSGETIKFGFRIRTVGCFDPADEIAEACGYQSVSAFSAAFARTVGRPPSDFRGAGKARVAVADHGGDAIG
jgi:AraC-like DNA-binding protein